MIVVTPQGLVLEIRLSARAIIKAPFHYLIPTHRGSGQCDHGLPANDALQGLAADTANHRSAGFRPNTNSQPSGL